MKIRRSIFLFCVAVVLATAFIIWFGNKTAIQPTTQSAVQSSVTQTNASVTLTNRTIVTQSALANSTGATISTNHHRVPPPKENKVDILKTILQANDADIVFYGRLQDQFGNAVGNANVNFNIRYEDLSGSGIRRGQVMVDGNGFFIISGYKGQELSIVPEKQGYVLASNNGGGKYSPFFPEDQRVHPDPNNPVVIEMWKLQGAESLISFNIQTYVPVDGTPITFDFQTGRQVENGGDIIVRVESPAKPNLRQGYDWNATVQPVNGGIIQPSDIRFEQMFAAPESGYENEFNINYQNAVNPWSSRFNGDFYFISRNGKCYGKFKLKIITDIVKDGAVPIVLNGYINSSGSRNLEIDPAKVIEAKP
jgi:hypothetical protein